MSTAAPPRPGTLVAGRFRIVRELGRGNFGVVYEAEQVGLRRLVALKFLSPSAVGSEGLLQRFEREARLASALTNRHALKIYDVGEHQSEDGAPAIPFIAMEHLQGLTVREWLATWGRPPLEHALAVLQQTLECLAEAHGLGIVHRDLKPANLFLVNEPGGTTSLRVLDFGIAKAIQGSWGKRTLAPVTAAGDILGTPAYMPPEQCAGEVELTPSADVYALGCVAFELLTGQLPFPGRTRMQVMRAHLNDPVPLLPDLPKAHPLNDILQMAMAKDPTRRFAHAGFMGSALSVALRALGIKPVMPAAFPLSAAPVPEDDPDRVPTLIGDGTAETAVAVRRADLDATTAIDPAPSGPQGGNTDGWRSETDG